MKAWFCFYPADDTSVCVYTPKNIYVCSSRSSWSNTGWDGGVTISVGQTYFDQICQMMLSLTTRCWNTMVSNFAQVAGVKYCLTNPRLGFTPFFWNGWPWDRVPETPHLCRIRLIPLDDSFHFCSFYRTNSCDILFLHTALNPRLSSVFTRAFTKGTEQMQFRQVPIILPVFVTRVFQSSPFFHTHSIKLKYSI